MPPSSSRLMGLLKILYRLRPSNDWALFKSTGPPQQRVDAQGQPVYEQWPTNAARPRPLLDFEILPDRIGSEEHWWRFEAWRRLDPRIRWCDISMRMETPYRISDVLLRSRVSRPRPRFNMLSWVQGPQGQTANDAIVRGLTPAQVQANTTRGSTPGLIDPALGRAGGRIYLLDEDSQDDTDSASSVSGEGDEVEGEGNDDKKGEEVTEEEIEEVEEEDDSEDTSEGPPPKRRRVGSANEGPAATGPTLNQADTVPVQQDSSVQTTGLPATMPRMTINSMLNDANTAPVSSVQQPGLATTRPSMTIGSMLNRPNAVPMQEDRPAGTSGLTASILDRRMLPFPF
ncbi:MAG: hypothetical protein Q9195_001194 [Heterodermia aff. obscurata]